MQTDIDGNWHSKIVSLKLPLIKTGVSANPFPQFTVDFSSSTGNQPAPQGLRLPTESVAAENVVNHRARTHQ